MSETVLTRRTCQFCRRVIRDPYGGGDEWWDSSNNAYCPSAEPFHLPPDATGPDRPDGAA